MQEMADRWKNEAAGGAIIAATMTVIVNIAAMDERG